MESEAAGLFMKTVVITGAGRGIGRVLARGFARHGARILVHYAHAKSGAEEVVEQIRTRGGNAMTMRADLSDAAEVARMVQEIHAMCGKIDIWINNAGASANRSETRGMSEVEMFNRIVGVDIFGTWRCCREVRPYMNEGGSILTTGWDRALDGAAGLPNQLYAISKGAIISLTRSLAMEYAPHIRVNCIAPGRIENEWSQTLPEATRRQASEAIPMKRWGTPEDVLNTALFLTSPDASFITGQVILINGGEIMR